ncbi:MAG: Xaa-Pro peptidase family protein [Thermoplasmata archaeon]|nr:Xaa-Pro peptidase family protein [Thermoplasmata archaeon]
MATKEKWIFSQLDKDVDAIVLMNGVEPNVDGAFFYATGIPNGIFEYCAAIVEPRSLEVLTSSLEETSAREGKVKATVFENDKQMEELMGKRLKGCKRVGINASNLTVVNYRTIKRAAKGARIVDITKDLDKARMIKQPDEIELIKKSCSIASKAGEDIPSFTKAGQLETGAAAELNFRMMELGASAQSFVTAVSFGVKTAEPHYQPQGRRLKPGQLALFDYGASYTRYASDITRTFICGRPDARQKELYDTVLRAQLAAIDAIHDGAHGKTVDKAARDIIDRSRFKGRFIHSTGHGLGISVHDPGSISPRRDMVLREGMVLTVEPGAYIRGYGGVRIEDDILVTKKGCKVLTPLTKEFLSV